jgi:membrane-associated protein
MTLGGYYLGNVAVVRHNFEKVVIGIVLVSVLPMVWQVWTSRMGNSRRSTQINADKT